MIITGQWNFLYRTAGWALLQGCSVASGDGGIRNVLTDDGIGEIRWNPDKEKPVCRAAPFSGKIFINWFKDVIPLNQIRRAKDKRVTARMGGVRRNPVRM